MSEPVIIRACVEQMSAVVDDLEIDRAEWDAMTPAQRREMIDDFGATTMNNAGGYGASILSGAPDSDLDDAEDAPSIESVLAGKVRMIEALAERYARDGGDIGKRDVAATLRTLLAD
jgi:hypothetical protein